jgi:SAM-dependent methyltransferase
MMPPPPVAFKKSDLDYFDRGVIENIKFFCRLNEEPNFNGLKVLDIGCGHGSLCVCIASYGAKRVVGIDIDEYRIDFAKENAKQNFSEFMEKLEFKNCTISELDEYDFDIIVSKDTFEHIVGLEYLMQEMIRHLKPNGRMLIGFGPLYNSPYGDHKRTESIIPWGHLLRSERSIIKGINKRRTNGEQIRSIYDLGLNKLSLNQYKKLFTDCGLKIQYFGINVSKNKISKLFSLLAKVPFLEEYFSHNIYCVLLNEST